MLLLKPQRPTIVGMIRNFSRLSYDLTGLKGVLTPTTVYCTNCNNEMVKDESGQGGEPLGSPDPNKFKGQPFFNMFSLYVCPDLCGPNIDGEKIVQSVGAPSRWHKFRDYIEGRECHCWEK